MMPIKLANPGYGENAKEDQAGAPIVPHCQMVDIFYTKQHN